ncbi:MAG: hypothetical protein GQ538_11750 [Xanthomonadales bacterium]|nr:hypothetical protein [Xanthomonadales bacterium]
MYQSKFLNKIRIVVVLGIGLLGASHVIFAGLSSSATDAEIAGELYLPSEDPMAAVTAVIQTARKNDKLALVILGANWCHDSRGLASRFHQEPMKSLIEENYETIFVDVGYLNKGKQVIESLGPPVYYATPTVLIIDPVSGELVNDHNRHQWADAFSISMDDTVAYFRQMTAIDLNPLRAGSEIGLELQTLLEEIDAFEQAQADRLYKAYAVLGSMLKEYKEGDQEAFSEEKWNEVRDFRYKVPYDISALKTMASDRVQAGESNIELEFPEYPVFSWEKDGQ